MVWDMNVSQTSPPFDPQTHVPEVVGEAARPGVFTPAHLFGSSWMHGH